MNNLDEQIRKKLQNDDIISKKAENIFNNFLKEEIKMNEENISNNNEKQKKISNLKRFLSIAACLFIILGAGNIYASTKGYGNIFFMIKYLVTGETIETSDKDEILSDRDITISYEPIRLSKNLRIQIRNLQIKNNEAKLKIYVNEENSEQNLEITPLKYKVYNSNNLLLCNQESSKVADKDTIYQEELILNNYNKDDNEIMLEIYQANNKKLAKININLLTKEITIEGEKEALQKISETELKEFLSIYSKLQETSEEDIELIIVGVEGILNNKAEVIKTTNGNAYKVEDINKVLKNCGYEVIPETYKKGEIFRRKTINNIDYIEPIKVMQPNKNTIIEIEKISYCDGIYSATFKYANINPDESFDADYSNVQSKEAEITFTLDNEDKLLKFHVVKYLLTSELNNDFFEVINEEDYSEILTDAKNGVVAFKKLEKENKLKTTVHDTYYTYKDIFDNVYNIKEIKNIESTDKGILSNDKTTALFKVNVAYVDNNNQNKNMELAIAYSKQNGAEIEGNWIDFTGTTSFVRVYMNSEDVPDNGQKNKRYEDIIGAWKYRTSYKNNYGISYNEIFLVEFKIIEINFYKDGTFTSRIPNVKDKNNGTYSINGESVELDFGNQKVSLNWPENSNDMRLFYAPYDIILRAVDKESDKQDEIKFENTTEMNNIKENNSQEGLLSKSEINSILGPDEATFCIENIEKSGDDYIITATMLNNQPRKISNEEYKDLLNGKEIKFRNQNWKMSSSDDYFIYIKSGKDTLTVLKNEKTLSNVAGVASELRDYSNKIIKFKVSKDILIGEFWSSFKYDENGQIKAYRINDDEIITNFESMSFERLLDISKGCKGTYDECIAYVKNGVVGAIKIFEK